MHIFSKDTLYGSGELADFLILVDKPSVFVLSGRGYHGFAYRGRRDCTIAPKPARHCEIQQRHDDHGNSLSQPELFSFAQEQAWPEDMEGFEALFVDLLFQLSLGLEIEVLRHRIGAYRRN